MNQAASIALLLDTLDALEFITRHMQPTEIDRPVAMLGNRDTLFRATLADAELPEVMRDHVERAVEATLRACDGLRSAVGSPDGLRQAYRASRQVSRALEALYPLAAMLPTVDRFFLAFDDRIAGATRAGVPTGVLHEANDAGERGGFSVYVPENYDPARAHPLVMALHGGSGHGRLFLWSWLREVRGRGVILVSSTAVGDTWSLMEPQVDSENLAHVLGQVAQTWQVDRTRLLLTGMSDGGTFTLFSGLDDESPFIHLAPVAASYHPLLLTMADPRRVTGLPVYLVHGALDWIFPVTIARTVQRMLTAAGANIVYREIADLSHVYPREEGSLMLDWFLSGVR